MHGVTQADVARFVALLERGDAESALRQTRALVESGLGVDAISTALFAPALVAAGEQWQSAQWTTAQEHQASTIVDACLSEIGAAWPPDAPGDRGSVVVGAAEGEWHALPARMVAEGLRSHGWKVTFVGASASPSRLRRVMAQQPNAVLLSCSMTPFLPGVERCIDALRGSGVPVIVGGQAFGSDARRALQLGAGAWAPDAVSALAVVDGLPNIAVPGPRHPNAVECQQLDIAKPELASDALSDLLLLWPSLAGCSTTELGQVRVHLELLVGALTAGLLLDDHSILAEFAVWMDDATAAHAWAHPPCDAVLDALGATAIADVDAAATHIEAARGAIAANHHEPTAHRYSVEMAETGGNPPEGVTESPEDIRDEPALSIRASRFDEAADAIRERARAAAARVSATTGGSNGSGGDPLAKLRRQAEHLFTNTAAAATNALSRSDSHPRSAPDPNGVVRENGAAAGTRAAQVVEAARAQAARLLDEAEADAARVRAAAEADAQRIRATADVAASEVLERAEAEALEWLAEAGRQVIAHLDDVDSEASRILASARAEAARITADASRMHSEVTASAADAVREAQEEAERHLAQAHTTASGIVVKARSEAAALVADAQKERTRLAEETEQLAGGAAELLERRLNEVEAARTEAAQVRAAADAAVEADTRRLLGEAQADCDRILAEARAEAEHIRRATIAADARATELDLRPTSASDPTLSDPPDVEVRADPPRRRRFRP